MSDTTAAASSGAAGAEGAPPLAAADSEFNTSSWADEMVSAGPVVRHAHIGGSAAAGQSVQGGRPAAYAEHAARRAPRAAMSAAGTP